MAAHPEKIPEASTRTDISTLPLGGGFLLAPVGSTRIKTTDDFTAEQQEFYKTAAKFMGERITPNVPRIEKKDFAFTTSLLREAGEIGLLSIDIPERFGGLGQDITTSVLVGCAMNSVMSWSVTFGSHVSIGTLPIVFFGTEDQKKRYLPKLATGELIAAYALSEPTSASDAMGAKTKAVKSPDGKHWILNGTKQWISNAGFADVFIVFAKVDGEHFTGFIVDRKSPGFTVGPEEHKMGIRGSSTCPLIFEDAKIPVENLLGEVGKGHKIAFNILNMGRLKLGAVSATACNVALNEAINYGRDRKAFGKAITEFGLIREKIARMAAVAYVGGAMSFRTTGLIDSRVASTGMQHGTPEFDKVLIASVEEYNTEASILKVWGTEMLFQCVDEAVQIHGGYGFVEEYAVERAYRDNRVNRIFEGTNEINRMLIPGTMLKRAMKGAFPLLQLAQTVAEAVERNELPPMGKGLLARQARVAELNKYLMVYAMRVAVETFGPELSEHQEVLAALADVAMEAYALDSAVARTLQLKKPDPVAEACVQLYAIESHDRAYDRAKRAIYATVADPATATAHVANLRKMYDEGPWTPTAWREAIVTRVLEHEGRINMAGL